MQCSKRHRIFLDSAAVAASKRRLCSCVAWGWRIYNIVESESDPLTRWPFRKRTPQGQMGGPPTYTHQVWRRSAKGPRRRQETHKHTNKRCSNYSMIQLYLSNNGINQLLSLSTIQVCIFWWQMIRAKWHWGHNRLCKHTWYDMSHNITSHHTYVSHHMDTQTYLL